MPPWGAGSKPKKTPANTVRKSTYSTSNRFGGPPRVSGRMGPQSGPPGSGRASQISRPAMAAAAVSGGGRRKPVENAGAMFDPGWLPKSQGGFGRERPPSGRGAVSTGGFGEGYGQIQRPSVPQPNRGYVSPAAVDRRATTPPSNTADRNMIAQANRAGAGSYDRTVFSPQDLMQAATSGAATAPAANAVQVERGAADRNMVAQAQRAGSMDRGSVAQPNTPQASPYAGLDLTSRANSNARMVLPSADE